MKIYTNQSVWDAALERIEFLFDEFKNVIICTSGGKDSTVTMNLALQVAEKKGRLPVKLMFLDQEAEWGMVVEHMREIMADPRVEPMWLQVPIKLFNATSMEEPWLMCWQEEVEWMRPKEDISIKENVYGTDRFHNMWPKILEYYYPDEPACFLVGVRAEESPQRLIGLTSKPTYKHITYGKAQNKAKHHYNFYPLYDWTLSDVWKSIHDNNWPYCKIYDEMYRYGLQPRDMRVSNLHHETAVHSLFFLSEVEPDTWDLLTKRLAGVNQAKHIIKKEMISVNKLPYMFESWKEYRDYLTDNLITIPEHRKRFKNEWEKMDELYGDMNKPEYMYKKQIRSILVNDWEFVKLAGFLQSPGIIIYRKFKQGAEIRDLNDPMVHKFLKPKHINELRASS